MPVVDPKNFPRQNIINPESYANIPYEDFFIKTEDGVTLHSWFIKQTEQSKKPGDNTKTHPATFIYFHGNAGNIGNRMPLFYELWKHLKVNILAVDYRGYGDSEGDFGKKGFPCEEGLQKDSLAVYKYLVEQKKDEVDLGNIIVFGRSLGGAVAFYLAKHLENLHAAHQAGSEVDGSQNPNIAPVGLPRALIIENTFLSIVDIGIVLLPFLCWLEPVLKPPFLTNVWSNKEAIKSLEHIPILFISARKDEIIPFKHMDGLYEIYMGTKSIPDQVKRKSEFYKVENGRHNDVPVVAGARYYDTIRNFLSKL